MTNAAKYDVESATGYDTYSGERALMTTSQHWDGQQKIEGRDGNLRPLGERLLRKKARARMQSDKAALG